MASYYNVWDAVIMPSRWEAFGFVAIEAIKYGKPVIASNDIKLNEIINLLKKEILFHLGISSSAGFKKKFTSLSMITKTRTLY